MLRRPMAHRAQSPTMRSYENDLPPPSKGHDFVPLDIRRAHTHLSMLSGPAQASRSALRTLKLGIFVAGSAACSISAAEGGAVDDYDELPSFQSDL